MKYLKAVLFLNVNPRVPYPLASLILSFLVAGLVVLLLAARWDAPHDPSYRFGLTYGLTLLIWAGLLRLRRWLDV